MSGEAQLPKLVRDKVDGGGFLCPKCNSGTRVLDSRPDGDGHVWRRRRLCMNRDCLNRFNTAEFPIEEGVRPEAVGSALKSLEVFRAALDAFQKTVFKS
jgi:transcriptional regulator NrdR family protein